MICLFLVRNLQRSGRFLLTVAALVLLLLLPTALIGDLSTRLDRLNSWIARGFVSQVDMEVVAKGSKNPEWCVVCLVERAVVKRRCKPCYV